MVWKHGLKGKQALQQQSCFKVSVLLFLFDVFDRVFVSCITHSWVGSCGCDAMS